MTLVKSQGNATLYRKESYCGRTTPIVEWYVKCGEQIIRICNTKREALEWFAMYA